MALQKQYYGIKYPFMCQDDTKYFVDLNTDLKDKARSVITHAIFTPKGQKLRDPSFGTDLIKYIFEQNDEIQWGKVREEIGNSIKKYMPNVTIDNIDILRSEEDGNEVFVKVAYTITNGKLTVSDSIGLEL